MKTPDTGGSASGRQERKPWKTVKGKCRSVPVYSWKSGGRTIYRILIPGRTPPHKTTTNKETILELAKVLADTPAHLAPTLSDISPAVLAATAEAILKLEPVLKPLGISIPAGIDEYAYLKSRTGRLGLRDLFEGLLTADNSANGALPPSDGLHAISAAITKLSPVLTPLDVSVASGIEEYAAVKAKAGKQDLRELFEDLLKKDWVQKSKTPVGAVVEEFLASRKNEARVSSEYYRTLYYTLGRMVEEARKDTPVGEVTTDQLKPIVFVSTREPRSNKTYRTNLRNFFKWCQLHQYLDYSQPTAADRLARIKVPPPAPRILSVEEAKAMLSAVENPWCLLYLALSLFTGIRHDELQEFTFDLIKRDVVEVTAEISKTGKRRLIPIQAVLQAWLAPFRDRAGLVLPIANIQAKVNAFLRRTVLPGLPSNWSRNWLRQSYASYRLAQTGKVLQTAAENGHYAYILESVYLNLSDEADALAFFSLSPEACGKSNWNTRIAKFLETQPELHARPLKEKKWKPIGGDKSRATPLPAQQPTELAA